ncbi:MAG: tRNA pseudouridine(38-40) synthase TruA [Thiotrichaceae bacterium]|nr:tRNA pseudouridine(38-40) synthase TruA [Thiotrichaceae bacterium]
MKYIACIEYDGSAYYGWQRLAEGPSVQQTVEEAISKVANHSVEVICAGRTDSGVHAYGQVIHFESDEKRTLDAWQMGTNRYLPSDISILWVQVASDVEFSARFSARYRRYRYVIHNRKARSAILATKVTWIFEPLNEKDMHTAAQCLVGEQDFSSFRASACQAGHARRNLHSIEVSRDKDFIYVDIVANAFLHHMVRNIVGSLLQVGVGKWPIAKMAEILLLRDRTKAGMTAAAQGLYFVHVGYPESLGLPSDYQLPQY